MENNYPMVSKYFCMLWNWYRSLRYRITDSKGRKMLTCHNVPSIHQSLGPLFICIIVF